MSHLTVFPAVPMAPSCKFTALEPLKMSPMSDSLAPSTPVPNDDMLAWLAPSCQDFDHSTPPLSPSISLADDPVLFDLDLGSETDPVTPGVLFSISDLMDVDDGHGIGFSQGIDADFDLSGLPHRDPTHRESEALNGNRHNMMESSTLVSDVLSDTQDSLTSVNEDTKPAPPPLSVITNVQPGGPTTAPSLSQTIENITLEPVSSPDLSRADGTISEKSASLAVKHPPKRSPTGKASIRAEEPVVDVSKTRSPVLRENGTERLACGGGASEATKGMRSIESSPRKRARTAASAEETRGKEVSNQTEKRGGKVEATGSKPVKIGMRLRRKGAVEKRAVKGLEDDKNVPVMDKCVKCSTMARNTPMMRKGPDGCRSLCNACGLRWSRHGIY